jgi:hypothetical protein
VGGGPNQTHNVGDCPAFPDIARSANWADKRAGQAARPFSLPDNLKKKNSTLVCTSQTAELGWPFIPIYKSLRALWEKE